MPLSPLSILIIESLDVTEITQGQAAGCQPDIQDSPEGAGGAQDEQGVVNS